MADPFLSEIRIVAFSFAPKGWALCNGQLLSISQNTALFSLLGTTYGGDGKSTFALPNFQGRVAVGAGQGPGLTDRFLGDMEGEETHTLLLSEIPSHSHPLKASNKPGTLASPQNAVFAAASVGGAAKSMYGAAPNATGAVNETYPTGAGMPHDNMQPTLVMNFIIALQGIFPARP